MNITPTHKPGLTDSAALERSHNLTVPLIGLAATLCVTGFYLFLFWNRFVGLRSGMGEFTTGSQFLLGLRPYRDYFNSSMPLNTLKSAVELWIFGNSAIVSRACGVAERLLIAGTVYAWLARLFKPAPALIAAVLTMIVSTGDTSDPLASYNHDAIFAGLISGLMASYAIEAGRSVRQLGILGLASGIAAGLSFATKQTIGPGMTLAVSVVATAYLFRLGSSRKALLFFLSFCIGWACIAAVLLFWLGQLGILQPFLTQVFVQGPAAKAGSPMDFLHRDYAILKRTRWSALLAVVALVPSAPLFWRSLRRNDPVAFSLRFTSYAAVACAAGVAVAALLEYAGVGHLTHRLLNAAIYFTSFWLIALTCLFTFRYFSRNVSEREAQFCLFTAVSLVSAFMLSLSYPIFEAMTLPGIGLLVAACIDGAGTLVERLAVYVPCALLLINATLTKLDIPFAFDNFAEPPVRTAQFTSSQPELKGFLLPKEVIRFVDETLATIKTHSKRDEKIFTYPEFVAFYALSGRWCPTFTCSHNIDVVNDAFAKQEAQRLLDHPPAVLIYQPQSEAFLSGEEKLWRHGARSGNRDLIAAVETLAHRYRLAGEYTIHPNPDPIFVYTRPTAAER